MRRQFVVLAALSASMWCMVACREGDSAAVAKHLVVVSIDTLRPDMLGAYGYDRPSSPNLDEFAASGVLFENAATVAPWTLPSHASLITGLYPRHHGAKRHVEALAEEVETLAERLRDAGFQTSAVVNSKFLDPRYGFQRGFDDFAFLEPTHDPETSSRVVDRSLDWLENRGDGRFFLLVHDLYVHSSYRALPRYHDLLVRPYEGPINGSTAQLRRVRRGEMSLGPDDLRHLIDLYVAGIRQLDDEFGRLIQGLKDLGVYQDTLVVVVSDHGEEFLEHGGVLHGRTQYEEMLRIPMIMRGPGLPAGLRVSSLVSLLDVFPTSLSLLGLPLGDELDGVDLGPSLRGAEQLPAERLLFGEADHNGSEDDITRSVRQGRYKLHYNRIDKSMQLYDLESDPGENRDLRRALPEVAERLMRALRSFTAKSVQGPAIAELSSTEREQLRELGYLEDITSVEVDDERRVRVVLVTLDTLRYDQLVSAEGTRPAMPRLADRAKRGLLFTRFYVPSAITQPSHASMLTGLQPWEHGVTRNGMVLPERVPNVVERLQRAGWSTAAVVASFPVTKRFGFGRGFDSFHEDLDRAFKEGKEIWENRWKLTDGVFFANGGDVTDRAIEAIDGADGAKQFFWVHYFDPHGPYGSSRGKGVLKGYITRQIGNGVEVETALAPVRAGYAADVAYLDAELDRLLRHLDAAARDFETHVLLVADHGESLGEGGYLGHGGRLTAETLRVPAVLFSPSVPSGRRDDVAAAIDVPRTLLALAGEPVGEGELGGRDLTSAPVAGNLAFGMRRTLSDGATSERYLDGSTLELEGHRYFQVDEQGRIVRGSGAGVLLPADTTGLDASARGRIASRFESFEVGLGESKAVEDLDPETERALRELGYIED